MWCGHPAEAPRSYFSHSITTPVNWQPAGEGVPKEASKVIVHPSVSNEEAEKIFGAGNVEYPKPYLRFTHLKQGS